MSLSDSDLELLENHLDGELTSAEDEALRDRMNVEPELAAMLEILRAERDARRVAFCAMEPDDKAVERFNVQATREIQRLDRESFWQRTSRRLRVVSAAAACLVIGFSVGRIANSGVLDRKPGDGTGTVAVNPSANSVAKTVEVVLTDDSGKEIGVQRFNSPERAREFINDVDRWQNRQQQLNESQVVPVSDNF
jgi:anti-sigma factor RsiW